MTQAPTAIGGIPVSASIPLRGVQRLVARRMLEGLHSAAGVTALAEVDATSLVQVLEQLRVRLPRLSLTHLLIKATALALRDHPRLNATLRDDVIHELAEINVGIAFSLPSDDLIVGAVRQADRRVLAEIVEAVDGLRDRAERGKLTTDDVRGSTFTLSNYGSLRTVRWATPIITPGQVAVLGVGRAQDRDGTQQRWLLPLSLTYDHRVVNGIPAGRFLDRLADLVEQPDWATEQVDG